jgi:hypothetical protein
MANLSEENIRIMLDGLEKLLRGGRPIVISSKCGINYYTDDGAVECGERNGSMTITIEVDGGAHDTHEMMPRNLLKELSPEMLTALERDWRTRS